MNYTRSQIFLGAAVVILVIFIGVLLVNQRSAPNKFSVVYMATGEVYIGELSTFPRLKLSNGYQYQAVQDPTDPKKTSFQLVPISEALWAPTAMYLNEDQVVFYGPITESSGAYKAIQTSASPR